VARAYRAAVLYSANRLWLPCALLILAATLAGAAPDAQYKVLKSIMPGGSGVYDYVYADKSARFLYVPRLGESARITIFDIDTLRQIGELPHTSAHGVAVSERSNHGFATSRPVAM
jgi:hypothetical protein